ncbi:hypothetical protein DFH29DRAFT_994839 [Suillus ampliporus]|nr:hypothetical protein DFH29DRAFT_994839 [Suillus ampliporus]
MMNASVFLFALFIAFAKASPSARPADVEQGRQAAPTQQTQSRWRERTNVDHFYTTNVNEMNNAVASGGYDREQDAAYVFTTQQRSTIPLYRSYNPTVVDHLYTTSYAEVQSAAANSGYNYEEIAAYVFDTNICGSIPLYRLYDAVGTDHFYTTSASEVTYATSEGNYTLESIGAYVLPVPA